MDRLDTLRVFVAVADARGFAPAARKLGLSAPAVTRAILALEARIGAPLLHRTTRSVHLSDAGERFLEDCRRILAELDEAESSAGGAHAAPQGLLTLTAPLMFGRMHVAPVLLDFLSRHPAIQVRSFFVDRVVHLLDEGFDVAVRIAHLPDSGLTAIRVGRVRSVVVASPDYLERCGTPQRPAELAQHDAIGSSPSGGAAPPWRFSAAAERADGDDGQTVRPRMQLVVNGADVAIAAALRGHGLARVLSYQVAAELQAGRLRIVLAEHEPPPMPVHVVYPAGRKASARLRAFIDFAVARLREDAVLQG
jgi:DNA-binding transcriptional LysR family regulator